jgi:internalin A
VRAKTLLVVLFVIAIVTLGVVEQVYYSDAVTFADPNVEAQIRDTIGKPHGDLCHSDLERIESLVLNGQLVSDLSGIEECTELKALAIHMRDECDLRPLSGLTELTSLIIYDIGDGNRTADLSWVEGLTRLEYLDLVCLGITDVSPLSHLSSLSHLAIVGGRVDDVTPLAGLRSLEVLTLGSNRIADIGPLAGLCSLTSLSLDDNAIADISPLAGLSNLCELGLGGNRIEDISPIAGLDSLNFVRLWSNRIEDISPLVENKGLGQGDAVYIPDNPLDETSRNTYVPLLQEKGVQVVTETLDYSGF